MKNMAAKNYLPTFQDSLPVFVGELRDLLFSSQREAATYFCLDRSRISCYETGKSTPNIGYLTSLVRLLAGRAEDEPAAQQMLLQEINKIMGKDLGYPKIRFKDWDMLCQNAEMYLSQQRAKREHKISSKNILGGL
jgi:hypothetical protein